MTQMMKPTPTEYRGTRFRSKSEAVFARCLDLAGWKWEYEPSTASHSSLCGHQWDFYAYRLNPFDSIYIEYKPSEPTSTYVEKLKNGCRLYWTEKCKEFISLLGQEHLSDDVRCQMAFDGPRPSCPRYLLFFGSPFNQSSKGESYTVFPIWDPETKHGVLYCPEADHGQSSLWSSYHELFDFGITEEMAQQARNYRFDLKN